MQPLKWRRDGLFLKLCSFKSKWQHSVSTLWPVLCVQIYVVGGELLITEWRFLRLRSHNQLSDHWKSVDFFSNKSDLLLKDVLLLMSKRVSKPVFGVQRAFLVWVMHKALTKTCHPKWNNLKRKSIIKSCKSNATKSSHPQDSTKKALYRLQTLVTMPHSA